MSNAKPEIEMHPVEPMAPLPPETLPATDWRVAYYFPMSGAGGQAKVHARSPGEAVAIFKENHSRADVVEVKLWCAP